MKKQARERGPGVAAFRGPGSCRRSPHLAHKAAAALGSHQILCVFHQGLMGRGRPCSPSPRRPLPPRAGGGRLSPGLRRLQGGTPGWARARGSSGSPRISPL